MQVVEVPARCPVQAAVRISDEIICVSCAATELRELRAKAVTLAQAEQERDDLQAVVEAYQQAGGK